MGQTIGTVQTRIISADTFLYEWHFCKVNFDLIHRSPAFGFTCKELSNCYLEMKPDIIHRTLTFFMRNCQKRDGSKVTANAVLIEGKSNSKRSSEYDVCLDLDSSIKIFEINLSDPVLSNCFNYVFKLVITLHSYSNFVASVFNENVLLQSEQNNESCSTAFNQNPPSLEYASTISSNETTSTMDFKQIGTSSIRVNKEMHSKLERTGAYSYTISNKQAISTNDLQHNRGPSNTFDEETSSKYLDYSGSSSIFNKQTGIKILQRSNEEVVEVNHSEHTSTAYNDKSKIPPKFSYTKELIVDFHNLYVSGDMCDLEIAIDGEVLRAHKLILCARSSAFKNMMKYECSGSCSNITLTDCSASSFKKFLKYLYSGEIEDSTMEALMSLYSLGKKYDVPVLPEACSKILQNKFSSESADNVANIICDILKLAECHSDSKLKDVAESFIVRNFPLVSNKQNWKDLMKSNFELTSAILALVASSLQEAQK